MVESSKIMIFKQGHYKSRLDNYLISSYEREVLMKYCPDYPLYISTDQARERKRIIDTRLVSNIGKSQMSTDMFLYLNKMI